MTAHCVTMNTPDGAFTVIVDSGNILASGWTDNVADLLALVHPTLRPELDTIETVSASEEQDSSAGTTDSGRTDTAAETTADAAVGDAVRAVQAYYNGDLEAPGRVPVRQHSGEFRMRAWDTLRQVRAGERITYSEYAVRAENPAAVRAAAGACALNAAALFVPCHRVLRTDGGLGGFRYGTEIKQRLLDRENPDGSTPALF